MAILFEGDSDYKISGPPEWSPSTFDLDQLIIPYRGRYSQLETFLSAHTPGEVSPIDVNMFLMQRLPDDHKQFPTVRMMYSGKRGGVLPPGRRDLDDDVMTASSKRSNGNVILTSPMVVEFYAPTSILTYYTRTNAGHDQADPPSGNPRPIELTVFDTSYSVGGTVEAQVNAFFTVQTISTNKSTEVVPGGQYWRNVSKKTKKYTSWIFDVPSGAFITLFNPGTGYQVGDIITIVGGGGVAQITVTSVIVIFGDPDQAGIYQWTVNSNTMTEAAVNMHGSGGSGSGAAFNVFILP